MVGFVELGVRSGGQRGTCGAGVQVENGVIRVMGEPFGYMYTREKYRNFVLELEYRWADGESNSGIFVLIEELLSPFPKAVECQLQAVGRATSCCWAVRT